MPQPFSFLHGRTGAYDWKLTSRPEDVAQALGLRSRAFRAGLQPDGDDQDGLCHHLLVSDGAGQLLGTCRLRLMAGRDLVGSYAGGHYDLTALAQGAGVVLELGRFCTLQPDADLLRLVWAVLTHLVFDHGVELLIGCTSFHGADPQAHHAALAYLRSQAIGPEGLRPAPKARDTVDLPQTPYDLAEALRQMPPLLRSYLLFGAWVSDHGVIDLDLDTLHVFTCLDIRAVPPARRNRMQAMAQALQPDILATRCP